MSKPRVIVEEVLAGKSQREVARLYGVSQPRVSQLLTAWRTGGWETLEPRSRRPLTSPSATSPELTGTICKLRTKLTTEHAGAPARMLIHNLDIIINNRDTGEILRELDIDPTKDSQPRGLKPGPQPGHKKGGMPKGYKFQK